MNSKVPRAEETWFRSAGSKVLKQNFGPIDRSFYQFSKAWRHFCALPAVGLLLFAACQKAPPAQPAPKPQKTENIRFDSSQSTPSRIDPLEIANIFPRSLSAMPRGELRALSKEQFRNNRKSWTEWLLRIAEMAEDKDSMLAILLLAEHGDEKVFPKLAMITRDDAWSDALRREAALGLVRHGNAQDAKIGIRSLGVLGTEADAFLLTELLRQGSLSIGLREAAALSLADTQQTGAVESLFDAFRDTVDWQDREAAEAFQKTLLDAAGGLPFAATETHFRRIIGSPSVHALVRAGAVEALAKSTQDSVPFLLEVAAGDSNSEVREMAAWAISNHGSFEGGGEALAGMTRSETDSAVRTRLYEAMLAQDDNPSARLLPVISTEENDEARIAAWNALGDAVSKSSEKSLKTHFDSVVIPRLIAEASGTRALNLRMRSVFALRRAQTPESIQALEILSTSSTPEIARAAANGLRAALVEAPNTSTTINKTYEN